MHLIFDLYLQLIDRRQIKIFLKFLIWTFRILKNYENFDGWKLEPKVGYFALFYPILFNFGPILPHNYGTCIDSSFIFSQVINNTSLKFLYDIDLIAVIFDDLKYFWILFCQKWAKNKIWAKFSLLTSALINRK